MPTWAGRADARGKTVLSYPAARSFRSWRCSLVFFRDAARRGASCRGPIAAVLQRCSPGNAAAGSLRAVRCLRDVEPRSLSSWPPPTTLSPLLEPCSTAHSGHCELAQDAVIQHLVVARGVRTHPSRSPTRPIRPARPAAAGPRTRQPLARGTWRAADRCGLWPAPGCPAHTARAEARRVGLRSRPCA